jgi:A/G-specific adenine glycosylase
MFDTQELKRPPRYEDFRRHVLRFYQDFGRAMPWRETLDEYAIFISEVMLQQTQVPRVMEKYPRFLDRFPSFRALADARLAEVYSLWQGLGYNRRAKYLHEAARRIVADHAGRVPRDRSALEALPGIGPNTAGSLLAFCHNEPVVFIETNIRRVFIYFFFPGNHTVHDRDLLPLIEDTLDRENPREWYYALMDYGAALSKWVRNPNRRSRQYVRQSPFENSNRQIRGRILRVLAAGGDVEGGDADIPTLSVAELAARVDYPSERVAYALEGLSKEGLVVAEEAGYRVP